MRQCIYKLLVDGEPFYVGRTNNPKLRLNAHMNDKGSSRKALFIQECIADGREIALEVIFETEDGLHDEENTYVDEYFDSGYDLKNSKAGDILGRLSYAEQAELRQSITRWKGQIKKRKEIETARKGFTPCEQCTEGCNSMCKKKAVSANTLFAQYKAGTLTLEELKEWSEQNAKTAT